MNFLNDLATKNINVSIVDDGLSCYSQTEPHDEKIQQVIDAQAEDLITFLEQEAYWQRQIKLAGEPALPTDGASLSNRRQQADSLKIKKKSVGRALSKWVDLYTYQHGVGNSNVFFTAFQLLLSKYTQQEYVCIYQQPANGQLPNQDGLPVIARLDTQQTFAEVLLANEQAIAEAKRHGQYPLFAAAKRLAQSEATLARLKHFAFVYIDGEYNAQASDAQLTLVVEKRETGYRLQMIAQGAQLSVRFLERIIEQLHLLIMQFSQEQQQALSRYVLLTDKDKQRILENFNATEREFPDDVCLHQLFAKSVRARPDAIAIVDRGRDYTYQELYDRSHDFALYLQHLGIKPDTLVGICLEPSFELIMSIWGILQAGGAYLPLDPYYPQERLTYMISDSAPALIITQHRWLEQVQHCTTEDNCLVVLDTQAAAIETMIEQLKSQHTLLTTEVSASNLAYVIYTSGSTGTPKGVMIEHRSVVNHNLTVAEAYRIDADTVQIQFASVGFDIFVEEVFVVHNHGATLVLADKQALLDLASLHQIVSQNQVSTLNLPTAFFHLLVTADFDLSSIKTIIVGGEKLDYLKAQQCLSRYPKLHLVNSYGPTETTVISTIQPVTPEVLQEYRDIPIGMPIANTCIYICNEHGQLLPTGMAGELCIGGSGLARGYLNQPWLSAEKFVPNPFRPKQRMYKTGDLARWSDDGRLTYLGRIDTQIKLHGYRIEVQEIEHCLNTHSGVRDSIVVLQKLPEHSRLVAFYLSSAEPPVEQQLMTHLQQRLPAYMLPERFVVLSQFPTTPNGKIDRRSLEQMPLDVVVASDLVAPVTEEECQLAALWAECFAIPLSQVGIEDSFVKAHVNSLQISLFQAMIRKVFQVSLTMQSIYAYPTIRSLLRLIKQSEPATSLPEMTPLSVTAHELWPLSYAQERQWLIEQLNPGYTAYSLPAAWCYRGALDIAVLEQAIALLANRHASLRTVFPVVQGKVRQQILPVAEVPFTLLDVSHYPHEAQRLEKAAQLCREEVRATFDLSHGPLFRVRVVKLEAEKHIVLLNMHHIISDGWSVEVLIQELDICLTALQAGIKPMLAPLSLQYSDYAVWQRSLLDSHGLMAKQLAYWRDKLSGSAAQLALVTDYPRPAEMDFAGTTVSFVLSALQRDALLQLAERQGGTLFMGLLAVFKVLLHRYTGQEDICVGTAVANRQYAEIQPLVGMFVNTLALRDTVQSQDSFESVLARVVATCLAGYDNQDVPFEKVVEALQPVRHQGVSPLFQVMMVLQNVRQSALDEHIQPYSLAREVSKFDLMLEFTESADGLSGVVEYSTRLFKAQTIEALSRHFSGVIAAVCAAPQQPIGTLSYLADAEKMQLRLDFNDTAQPYDERLCIHDLFIAQVHKQPEARAVSYAGESLSYQALYERSSALALYLQAQGVGPEVLVGLCLVRSLDMMVAILAVLQAGGAYVPFDPDYPDERLSYMLQNSPVACLLTQRQFECRMRQLVQGETALLVLDAEDQVLDNAIAQLQARPVRLNTAVRSDNMAYVIYTSGSTGRPKGVMICHKALLNRIVWMQHTYGLTPADVVLQKTPYSFDVSVWEFLLPLMAGAAVVFAQPGAHGDPDYLSELIVSTGVTTLHFVPSMLNSFLTHAPQQCPEVRRIFSSGEALGIKAATSYQQVFPAAKLYNLYGPTEAAIDVTAYDCSALVDADRLNSVPIGKPIANIRLYVLDAQLQLQPLGMVGELHIAGDGLARGYINQDELTAEKFIANPFESGSRMYKTGDLVRWLADGNLEYLGRIDSQIKLRGFRIEIAEIEYQLEQHPEVEVAAVVVQGQGINQHLVAFIQANKTQDAALLAQLKQHLAAVLPDYMMPAQFVVATQLPLTPSGKVNRIALQAQQIETVTVAALPGHADLEQQLVLLWAEILGLAAATISPQANFFALGGNSLTVVELAARIRQMYHCDFVPALLFKHNTIHAITLHLREQSVQMPSTASPSPIAETSVPVVVADDHQQAQSPQLPDYYQDSFAVVGLSCRFPQAADYRQFWANLLAGKECVVHLSKEQAAHLGVDEQILQDPSYVALNPWIEEKACFDPEFFRLSAGNAALMDPQFRQLLMHSWKAVEDAGYLCDDISRTSVFVSVSNNFYQALADNMPAQGGVMTDTEDFVSWLMAQGGTIPTMISYQLGFTGPSLYVHSNCSSSLSGVYAACQSLSTGDADYALVGAASFTCVPTYGYLHQPGMNLSSDGHLKAFDASADGMIEGEGVGVVMLRRATDAIADGNHIYCLIRGIGINNDGSDKAGYYAPSVKGQSAVICDVLKKTGVDPETICYVEAHGTGTSLGDPIELMGLSEAYRQHTQKRHYCAIGSVKANIGHLDTAAGLAGLIKLALGLHDRTFPAQINYKSPNPQIDFSASPFYVADRTLTWSTTDEVRRAALSAFGIGGTNTHAIFEEYRAPQQSYHAAAGSLFLVPLSARRADVLRVYAQDLLDFITAQPYSLALPELACTMQTGRKAFEFRLAFVVCNIAELQTALSHYLAGQTSELYVQDQLDSQQSADLLLVQDEDFNELLTQWISKGKLHKVAAAWSKGAQVNWSELYSHGLPAKISLPTYPFAKEKYWIDVRSPASSEAGTGTALHPLLQQNTSDFTAQCYETTFTGKEFFLREHQIDGNKILPAVAYLEMTRAAICSATGAGLASEPLELSNIVWMQPAVVSTAETLRLTLDVNEYGEMSYQIDNVSQGEAAPGYCQGNARLIAAGDEPERDLVSVKAQWSAEFVDIDIARFYDDIRSMGTQFGPAFRSLRSVQLADQQLLAVVSIPASVQDKSFVMHPSIMDGALQTCLLLLAGSQTLPAETALPFAMDSLKLLRACDSTMLVWTRFAAGSQRGNKLVKMDLDLFNEAGELCIQIRGFCSRAVARQLLNPQPTAELLLAQPHWRQQQLQQRSTWLAGRHEILLLDLPAVSTDSLQQQLQGITCHAWVSRSSECAEYYQQAADVCMATLQSILWSKPTETVLLQVVVPHKEQGQLLLGLQGMLKTATLENPQVVCQLVLVERSESARSLAPKLMEAGTDLSGCIRYQGAQAQVLQWLPVVPAPQPPVVFKDDGVYVITGGLGGLGLQFTREILAQTSQATIVLTGRFPLGPAQQAKLAALPARAGQLAYRQLDLQDQQAVTACLADIAATYQNINGILHAAGMIDDGFLLTKSSQTLATVLQPKVAGTVHLDLATKDMMLDFMVLFSSVSALGSLGQADYAAANGFIDQYAHYRNQLRAQGLRAGQCVAINWPLWQDGGMQLSAELQAQAVSEMGMVAMASELGMHAFYQCLASQQAQMLVLAGERERLNNWLAAHTKAHQLQRAAVSDRPSITDTRVRHNETLQQKTIDYLLVQCAQIFKIDVQQMDPKAQIEQYGIDSILAISLTNQLEKTFGPLSKTLLFEYRTVLELAHYFLESFTARLLTLFDVKSEVIAGAQPHAAPDTASADQTLSARTDFAKSHRFRALKAAAAQTFAGRTVQLEDIAIVGISGRYPGADDVEAFWHNLSTGVDSIGAIPQQRWDWQQYYSADRTEPGRHYSNVGGFIAGVDEFDAKFFNISPREASVLDPQERLFLQHAWMAVEDAGYTRDTLRKPYRQDLAGQVGVYVGVMYSEYQLYGAQASMQGQPLGFACSLADIANRVSYVLNIHGPSMTIDTMCSSSLTAIHLACQDLKLGRIDFAISGGVNVNIHPNKYTILSSDHFISTTGRCKSFGEGGEGYIPGEGVGAVLLKRLSDAEQDGDHIYGVIKGSAVNHGGKTNGYTVPNPQAQASVVSMALDEAGIEPRHVSYIEAHGTGTKLGDPIEVAALTKSFYRDVKNNPQQKQETGFCMLGSAKSNIGHCEPAAGIAGLTKVLLQMKHRQIVPSLHSATLNPHIDFAATPFVVNQTLTHWPQPVIEGKPVPRIAGISSFGAGGANGHLIVQEYVADRHPTRQQTQVLVVMSARTTAQLDLMLTNLSGFVRNNLQDIDLLSLAYTLQTGREAMAERIALLVGSVAELQQKLTLLSQGGLHVTGVYQGRIQKLNERKSATDTKQNIERWLTAQDLASLAQVWINGYDVNWSAMYQDVPAVKRMSLPAYPFARDRYWWTDLLTQALQAPVIAKSEQAVALPGMHPVVQRNTSVLGLQKYSSVFRGTETFLQPAETTCWILPLQTHLEMALVASRDALILGCQQGAVEVRHLNWLAEYRCEGQTQLSVCLRAGSEVNTTEFEIYVDETTRDDVLSQGQVSFIAQSAGLRLDVAQMQAKMQPVQHRHAGTSQLQVDELYQQDQQMLCTATVTKRSEALSSAPQALDQVLGLAISEMLPQAPAHLPVSIDRLRLYAPCPEQFVIIAKRQPAMVATAALVLDIDLYTIQGEHCVQLTGVCYLQLPDPADSPTVTGHKTNVRPSPLAANTQTPVAERLIFEAGRD